MNRRSFGLFSGTSLVALLSGGKRSCADVPSASMLNSATLTPVGAERAGNASGTIPAWTGGLTEIPPGFDWEPTKTLAPDFFAADKMLYKIDASNMATYAELLSECTMKLMQNKGFYIEVYPTRRTAAAPQWVYDNIAKNVSRTTPQNGDYRFGFNGAYGGIPFPIPDSDPGVAGAQIIWNHQARWSGTYFSNVAASYVVSGGTPVLASANIVSYRYDFYLPGGSPETFSGYFFSAWDYIFAPSTSAGEVAIDVNTANSIEHEQMSWALLAGQGRVRRTPNLMFDTPVSFGDGAYNCDEAIGFDGPIFKYDWKLLGKQEKLIPYNCNKMFTANSVEVHKPNFFDPEYTRWELHRVWVVEATLHPGERNVLARRRFYIDEDDWTVHLTDGWDSAGNPYHVQHFFTVTYPNVPGNIEANCIVYNLQLDEYVSEGGSFANAPYNVPYDFTPKPNSRWDPSSMAAAAAY